MSILVSGSAGFIGFHVSKRLLENGYAVIGFDNLNEYYDRSLKEARTEILKKTSEKYRTQFNFIKGDLSNKNDLKNLFETFKPTKIIHLAAQAGVRYSLENPDSYIQSNIVGFGNILEVSRKYKVENLIYASSSSVYGGNTKLPFNENDSVDHPVSLYAASKKANEVMAHSYSHLFNIPVTGLRFFTVYGPWGRPDMALFLFTKAIINNEPIDIFNNGNMTRDFTYIDDIVESLMLLVNKPAEPDLNFDTSKPTTSTSWAPHRIFNIGNSNPTQLMDYISAIEDCLGLVAKKRFLPLQIGDVEKTASDTSALQSWVGFKPKTSVKTGVRKFVEWYKEYYLK
jgi:UDP-glucuronate 4-epimerase